MNRLVWIGLAGGTGALARYAVGVAIGRRSDGFPLATLLVNLTGCLLLGFLVAVMATRLQVSDEVRLAVTVGFLGAFTTFSTFGVETISLLNERAWSVAALYVGVSVVGGLLASWVGLLAGNRV